MIPPINAQFVFLVQVEWFSNLPTTPCVVWMHSLLIQLYQHVIKRHNSLQVLIMIGVVQCCCAVSFNTTIRLYYIRTTYINSSVFSTVVFKGWITQGTFCTITLFSASCIVHFFTFARGAISTERFRTCFTNSWFYFGIKIHCLKWNLIIFFW